MADADDIWGMAGLRGLIDLAAFLEFGRTILSLVRVAGPATIPSLTVLEAAVQLTLAAPSLLAVG